MSNGQKQLFRKYVKRLTKQAIAGSLDARRALAGIVLAFQWKPGR